MGILLASCGRSATIQHTNGSIVGQIGRSTPSHLRVETARGDRLLPSAEVLTIDHPGNVAALTGLALTTWGIIGLLNPATFGCKGEESAFCGLMTIPVAATGLGLSVYGAWVWGASVSAASDLARHPPGNVTMRGSRPLGLRFGRRF